MGIFDDMLKSDETLFKNPVALDYDFLPKLVPYRENEQFTIASCIKPLFSRRNAKNIIVHGKPGVGKTVACRHVLKELKEKTEDIIPIYINCWKKNTTYQIMEEMCQKLGYKMTHNKKTDELLDVVVKILNKNSAVLVFDEIDKVNNHDFLYYLLESVYRKCIILITNYKEWYTNLDDRIRSRLLPELCEFEPYNYRETKGIIEQRIGYAFHAGVFDENAAEMVARKTFELEDIRSGLYILREAANIAEEKAKRKVTTEFVESAIEKLDKFKIKNSAGLDEETKMILEIVKDTSGKIGELFKVYQEKGGELVYKSFQRKIKKLEEGKFITVEKKTGGTTGTTTIIKLRDISKKLTDY